MHMHMHMHVTCMYSVCMCMCTANALPHQVYEAMRTDALTGADPMLPLPADAPLHRSLAGCPYCENFCAPRSLCYAPTYYVPAHYE